MTDEIVIKKNIKENIAYLTLNRPENSNSLNRAIFVTLKRELDDLEYDDNVRVVIITGEGSKAFCAGIDLKERAKMPKNEIPMYREKIIRSMFNTLGRFPKPTIAAVNGAAYGGGAEVAIACDMRVASTTARFSQSEIKWGMIPACGACQRLRMVVGIGRAKEIILTGRVVGAEEGLQIGLYNSVAQPENLMEEATRLAMEIAKNSPVAVKQAKKAIDVGANISESLDFEFEVSKECYSAGNAMTELEKF